jgi:hypothetical protein
MGNIDRLSNLVDDQKKLCPESIAFLSFMNCGVPSFGGHWRGSHPFYTLASSAQTMTFSP